MRKQFDFISARETIDMQVWKSSKYGKAHSQKNHDVKWWKPIRKLSLMVCEVDGWNLGYRGWKKMGPGARSSKGNCNGGGMLGDPDLVIAGKMQS